MANNRKHDRWLTDEQVETEIAVLTHAPLQGKEVKT